MFLKITSTLEHQRFIGAGSLAVPCTTRLVYGKNSVVTKSRENIKKS